MNPIQTNQTIFSGNGRQIPVQPAFQKKQVTKMKAIISQFQTKLDKKVDQVITDILNHSKKNNDVTLPEIINRRSSAFSNSDTSFLDNKSDSNNTNPSYFQYNLHSAEKGRNSKRQRVLSNNMKSSEVFAESANAYGFGKPHALGFIHKRNAEQTRHMDVNRTIIDTHNLGRSMGKQTYKKPRIMQRQHDILSKEMRWNPFYDKNAIKAHELDQGMLSLLQKGKIGKDVDIITAFEKGRPVLDMKPAIFHHAEQKFSQDQQSRIGLPKHLRQQLQVENSHEPVSHNAWAITALPQYSKEHNKNQNIKTDQIDPQISRKTFIEGDSIYIQFLHYKVVQNQNYHRLRKQSFEDWASINALVKRVEEFLAAYTHQIVFADSKKLQRLSTLLRKPTAAQLLECIVVSKGKDKKELTSIKCIKNLEKKKVASQLRILSTLKANVARLKYLRGQHKRKIEYKICQWARNSILIKKYKKGALALKQQTEQKFSDLQRKFRQQYSEIASKKHYEIHLANKHHRPGQKFREILNTDIVKIFNLENPNTHIIYLCPFQLSQDTTSYYYKIMELEQIQNYRERVSFLEVDPEKSLRTSMSMSARLYYSSKTLRRLRRKTKGYPAYFVTSYPSHIDIGLSCFLNLPILSGNLLQINKIQKRSSLTENFSDCQFHKRIEMKGGINSAFQISNEIISFCESFKGVQRFVVKLNDHYQSSGVALLAYPFTSLPEMYSKTTLVSPECHKTIDSFYLKLAKKGGIIQKYDQSTTPVTVVGKISETGQYQFTGTFEKISFAFINVGYLFPQRAVSHRNLIDNSNKVVQKLVQCGHFGHFQITFFVDNTQKITLQKVQFYLTRIGASLCYFKFLSGGYFNTLGEFMTKIYDNQDNEQAPEEYLTLLEQRGYCFLPYILHYGLSERQSNSFFQLCRMGGVSFDLQNKYGSTFILLGNLRSSLGIITTAKDRKKIVQLMINSLEFLLKQNSHNISNEMLRQKELITKERVNIGSVKDVLEGYL